MCRYPLPAARVRGAGPGAGRDGRRGRAHLPPGAVRRDAAAGAAAQLRGRGSHRVRLHGGHPPAGGHRQLQPLVLRGEGGRVLCSENTL